MHYGAQGRTLGNVRAKIQCSSPSPPMLLEIQEWGEHDLFFCVPEGIFWKCMIVSAVECVVYFIKRCMQKEWPG